MKHLNIEIKAKCDDHNLIRNTLLKLAADFKGTDHQIDTYFKVANGRLKLREGNIENFLVYYERENSLTPKQSKVLLYESNPQSNLKDVLINANGILTVVDKIREIYFIENVKFHIDTVKDLGTFVEIEAIDSDGTIGKEKLEEQCQTYIEKLAIKKEDYISVSYSDLLLQNL
jgi:predicted adenylyl cyclase CyaB